MTTEPQLSTQGFTWQPNKKILLLSFCLFPLLVTLGFWQLDRADEKQSIVNQYNANQQAAPASSGGAGFRRQVSCARGQRG